VTESALYNEIIGAHSHGGCRIFRQNAGLAWQGRVIEQSESRLVLAYPRPIKLGAPGMSDLIGWSAGSNWDHPGALAVFTAIECKGARGRLTDEQSAFLSLVRRSGGRAGVARSVEEAGLIIDGRQAP
jgi:hypothetical protein